MPHASLVRTIRFTAGHDDLRSDRGAQGNGPVVRGLDPTGRERIELFAWEYVAAEVEGR